MDTSKIKETIPQRIKELRVAKGLSQQQLADAVKITRAAICGYEKGKQLPTLENLLNMADVLGVTLNELVYGPSKNAPGPSLEQQFSEIFYRIGVGIVQWGFTVLPAKGDTPMDAVFAHTALHYNNKAWDGALTEFAALRGVRMSLPKDQVFAAIENVAKKYAKEVVQSDLFRFTLGAWPN